MTRRTAEEWRGWIDEVSRGENREAWRGIACFLRWLQIREQNGHPSPNFLHGLEADLRHSRLLARLLEGKEPLDQPPPEQYGQGWYELIETGRGTAREVAPWQWAPESKISIEQDIWLILHRFSDEHYLVTYRSGGEPFELRKVGEQAWQLQRLQPGRQESPAREVPGPVPVPERVGRVEREEIPRRHG